MLPQSLFLEICASLYMIPFCWIKEFNQYNGNEISIDGSSKPPFVYLSQWHASFNV